MKEINVKIIQRVTEEWSGTVSIPDNIEEADIQNYINDNIHGSNATMNDLQDSYNMKIEEILIA
jgi:hypothetical protein